jgi:hypothetical protein
MTDTNEAEDIIEAARAALLHLAAASEGAVRTAAMRLTKDQARDLAMVLPVFVGEWSTADEHGISRSAMLAEPCYVVGWVGGAFFTKGYVHARIVASGTTLEETKAACEAEMRRLGYIPIGDLEGCS